MARRARKEEFDPLIMGVRQLEWHLIDVLRQKFGRNVSYYWNKREAPINVLRGKTEKFIMDRSDEGDFFSMEYRGSVSARGDGTLRITLSHTEMLDGMKKTETFEIY